MHRHPAPFHGPCDPRSILAVLKLIGTTDRRHSPIMQDKYNEQGWKRWLSPSAILLFVLVALAARADFFDGLWSALS